MRKKIIVEEYIGKRFGSLTIVKFSHNKDCQFYFYCDCDCGAKNMGPIRLSSLKNGHTKRCGHCSQYDIIGKKFGHLTVVKFAYKNDKGKAYYYCNCDCGATDILVKRDNLISGNTTSCRHCNERTLIDKIFTNLTVTRFSHRDEHGAAYFYCKCACGKEEVGPIQLSNLLSGSVSSCGCCRDNNPDWYYRDIIGQKFGMLTIVKFSHKNKHGHPMFICRCECGELTTVCLADLRSNHTTSCGCRKETKGEEKVRNLLDQNNIKHITQFNKFPNLSNRYKYDFYIPTLNRIIEYDGEFHFMVTSLDNNLETQIQRDDIKNKYCWDNNIEIIRIPFWDYNTFTYEDLISKNSKYLIANQNDMDNIRKRFNNL